MLEKGRRGEYYYGPEIVSNALIPVEQLPLLHAARMLEQRVNIKILGTGGQSSEFEYQTQNYLTAIPMGQVFVAVSTHDRSLDSFWNTFAALCEYDKSPNDQC